MARPKLGFLGVGWIGRHRMEAMLATGVVEAAAIADPSPDMAAEALKLAPEAKIVEGLEGLLAEGVDSVVIATPSALHAEQSIRALEAGAAVFCQKPLGRNADEARAVVEAARKADRLLAVDFSYRFTEGMRRIRELLSQGALGRVYAVDLVFHNAYGPDKAWFYDPALSGGGCVMDLGVHLVDLALWAFDFPKPETIASTLLSGGAPLAAGQVEDYAVAQIELEGGTSVRLACSWRLPAGRDAIISAAFYGTEGGAALNNVRGSFYDFTAEHYRGTSAELLAQPPDSWGGRAGADWAQRLAAGERFDPSAERLVEVAETLDRIYGR
ncbi:MAG TPA: Gfo/Idh/MocA family oxidoreductase [Allosphingosinicella sp.]|jgi:predicted dehydrogenase|nr:Gfo/Idh/MocA family oxidoreductase [Allosphingosinicella sp.]